MITVVVTGAAGKMGKEVLTAVTAEEETELVGAVDPHPTEEEESWLNQQSAIGFNKDLNDFFLSKQADVLVDFTSAEVAMDNIRVAIANGAHVITGTTGLKPDDVSELQSLSKDSGKNILLAPNFAIGAVLMMKIAEMVAPYAKRAEVIELHHDNKIDAPSGTAKMTAELVGAGLNQSPLPGDDSFKARGETVNNVPVHSVRLPGLVAHQEVIFGFTGQTLTIRHDSIERRSFMPGVILAIKTIHEFPGFSYGLDKILDL